MLNDFYKQFKSGTDIRGVASEGDRLNLRSKLCQLVGLTRLIEGGKIAEASIICENKNDECKLFRLNMFGDTGNAKIG